MTASTAELVTAVNAAPNGGGLRVVLLLTRSDTIGGANVHVRDLALGLLRRGIDTTVLVGGDGPFIPELERNGISYEAVPGLVRAIHPRSDLTALTSIISALRRLRPTLIAAHTAKAGLLGRVAGRVLGLPVIYTPHCWAFDANVPRKQAWKYLQLERLAGRLPSLVINVSGAEREHALHSRVGDPDKHLVIRNGVFDASPALFAKPGRQPPKIIMVARCEEPKDHASMLRALRSLTDLEWSLEFVGGGPLLEANKKLAADLGLMSRVTFLGSRGDVAERLADAQIFTLLSRWESMPVAVLEAMRAGLPVVASEVGGMPEAVEEGKSGFVVPVGDIATLSERLRRLIVDPQLRERFGEQSRLRFLDHFTFEQMFVQTMAAYATALRPGASGGRGLASEGGPRAGQPYTGQPSP